MSRIMFLSFILCALVALWACNAVDETPPAEVSPAMEQEAATEMPAGFELAKLVKLEKRDPMESEGLHNVFVLSENIISGSEPHGEAAFQRLQEMGVKTVMSVDGKLPDAELATKYGLRYVHIPIQYKGIEHDKLVHIAKSFRELEGPFFVHCFHGRHRGPAAAAVGRLILDQTSRHEAVAEMRQWCGTSKKYGGLYDLIARGEMPSADETSASNWEFESAYVVKGIAGVMVPMVRAHDALRDLSKNDWKIDADHPDIDPINEATILLQAFESMERLPEVIDGPAPMKNGVAASLKATRSLLGNLREVKGGSAEALKAAKFDMRQIKKECAACHTLYRNT